MYDEKYSYWVESTNISYVRNQVPKIIAPLAEEYLDKVREEIEN